MRGGCLSIGLLFIAGGVITHPCQAQNLQTIRVSCISSIPLPIVVAEMHGTFAKYGIAVQAKLAPNSSDLREDIADGRAEIAHSAVDNDVALVEAGTADVVIVMGGEGSTNELISQPEVHSISALRGRLLIVDALDTAYALQLRKILLSNGLAAGKDYQLKAVGSTPLRLTAMRDHKEYAASILGAPTSILAKHDGFVSLGTTQKLIGPYQAVGAYVQRKWARENSTMLEHYMAAFIEAQRWLLDPENKQQVIELLMKQWSLSQPLAEEAYRSILGPGGYQKDAGLDIQAFSNVLKLRAEVEGQWGGQAPRPDKYYDLTYYKAAVSLLKAKH
jgi:ABC-type nitrate/sulfonate/bicarbonate transport system substrate-binding protein